MTNKPMGVAVRAVIRNVGQQWLLVRRSDSVGHFAGEWEVPGGKLDPGERLDQALTREIFEETGLIIHPGRLAGVCEFEFPHVRAAQVFFEATTLSNAVQLSDEHNDFVWLDQRDIAAQTLTAQVRPFLEPFSRSLPMLQSSQIPLTHSLSMSLSTKAVLRGPDDRILIIQRSASSKGNAGKWEFPGGKCDPGETVDSALAREIREETGLEISIGPIFGSAESILPDRRIIYLIFEVRALSKQIRLSAEHDQFVWARIDDLSTYDFSCQFRAFAQALTRSDHQPILETSRLG
jgi:8-oxo-dGTP diphosphatase